MEGDAEAIAVGAEAEQLREPRRRERADVLALERERDRLVDERRRLGDGRFGRLGRQLGLDVGQRGRQRPYAGQRRLRERRGQLAGVDGVARARRDDSEAPSRRRPAPGAASAARRRRVRRRPSSWGRGTSTGSTTRVGGLGSTSCRIRLDEARPAGVPERLLRRRGVDPQRLGRLDVVRLAADDDVHRRLQLRLAELDARQRPVPVVGIARGHAPPAAAARQASTATVMSPTRLMICKVAAEAGLHSFP